MKKDNIVSSNSITKRKNGQWYFRHYATMPKWWR